MVKVAALFVQKNGAYYGLDDVDPWDEARDARLYAGPYPVVAHPPCERWGRYATGGPNPLARRRKIGDDNGCFASALASVRQFGGVLEHPAGSLAWKHHGIAIPTSSGGWIVADKSNGNTCRVDQGRYGHLAKKATWLYAVGIELTDLDWTRATGIKLDEGWHSTAARRRARSLGVKPVKRLTMSQKIATPVPFRDLLLSMARSVNG